MKKEGRMAKEITMVGVSLYLAKDQMEEQDSSFNSFLRNEEIAGLKIPAIF